MAAFLNKPSDFTTSSDGLSQEPIKLIPPSEFAKPKKVPETRREEKKISDEFFSLKLENQRLKDKLENYATSKSAQVSGSFHRSLTSDERRYADELISRQSEDLSKLRSQLQRLEHEQQALRDEYEHRLTITERDKEETVATLNSSLQQMEEEYEKQIARLTQKHDGEITDLQSRLQHVSCDLDQSKGELTSQLTGLLEELQAVKRKARETEEALQLQIREKEAALQERAALVEQLRTYISDSEMRFQPQKVLVEQCETWSNKYKILEAENENLKSSKQLLDVRLSSMKEILNTQEKELSKAKEGSKKESKELLLTRWRQKVYELLIQQKTAHIVNKKDMQNWKEKISMLEDKLASAENSIRVLQHTVTDRDADLQMSENSNKRLQEEFNRTEQVAVCMDAEMGRNSDAVNSLAEAARRYEEGFIQQSSVLQQAMGQLKSLGQRITFASSRMNILTSQFTRKQALQQLEEKPDPVPAELDSEEILRLERDRLSQELVRVSGERDMLAAQLTQDSQTWADKTASLRSHYEAEVSTLKRTVEDLELTNQEKSKAVDQLCGEREAQQSSWSQASQRVEELSRELARHEHMLQEALAAQRKELEAEFSEHFADMERQVNEARREHTKAVVLLRQQERQWNRERERSEEIQSTTQAHYAAQFDRLHHELQNVEKERNIFMATLRQEGLLGRLRSERGEAMRLELEDPDPVDPVTPESQSVTEVTETDSLPAVHDSSEPVSAVLQDLKSLVPAVLEEDSLDSSDDNRD